MLVFLGCCIWMLTDSLLLPLLQLIIFTSSSYLAPCQLDRKLTSWSLGLMCMQHGQKIFRLLSIPLRPTVCTVFFWAIMVGGMWWYGSFLISLLKTHFRSALHLIHTLLFSHCKTTLVAHSWWHPTAVSKLPTYLRLSITLAWNHYHGHA